MTDLEKVKAEIERLKEREYYDIHDEYDGFVRNALDKLLSFIDSLEKEQFTGETMMEKDNIDAAFTKMMEKEPHFTKRNELFDKCVANVDPKTMKEVSENVDKALGRKRKPSPALTKIVNGLTEERLEKTKREMEEGQVQKIKGWVARCKWPCPEELYFYRGEEKPIRCGSQVEDVKEDFYWDFQHEVAPLDPALFPDLKWEDEPIEVELTIHRV